MTPKKVRAYSLGFLLLLVLLVIASAFLPKAPPPTGDLALNFLGVTNNPARSLRPVRFEMIHGTTGLCAVFEVKSLATNCYIQFEHEATEKRVGDEWVVSSRVTQPLRMAGHRWSSGYSCLYALAWPAELPTNASWRATITVQRETEGFRRWVNDRFRGDIFKLPLYGKHTIYSGDVDAAVPFAMPK